MQCLSDIQLLWTQVSSLWNDPTSNIQIDFPHFHVFNQDQSLEIIVFSDPPAFVWVSSSMLQIWEICLDLDQIDQILSN